MIEVLSPNTSLQAQWLPDLIGNLEKERARLKIPIELIVDKILRGEYAVFNVNNELIAIGYVYNNGIIRTCYVFWIHGKNLNQNFLEIVSYVRDCLGCSRFEFRSESDLHNRLYLNLARGLKMHKSTLFEVEL